METMTSMNLSEMSQPMPTYCISFELRKSQWNLHCKMQLQLQLKSCPSTSSIALIREEGFFPLSARSHLKQYAVWLAGKIILHKTWMLNSCFSLYRPCLQGHINLGELSVLSSASIHDNVKPDLQFMLFVIILLKLMEHHQLMSLGWSGST